jgi:hypothetical protein
MACYVEAVDLGV